MSNNYFNKYLKYKKLHLNLKKNPNIKDGMRPTLSLTLDPISQRKEQKIQFVSDRIKHMSKEDVECIFSQIKPQIKNINIDFNKICEIKGRKIIKVNKIIYISLEEGFEKEITEIVNMGFYMSSGKSRQTGLENIWLPTTGISSNGIIPDCNQIKLNKLEDEYLTYLDSDATLDNKYKKSLELEPYLRFINKINVVISIRLSELEVLDMFKQMKDMSEICDTILQNQVYSFI
uniref:Uncharacterized protein n=1 Tax=viral metagenome TaxID=1070528 RepID=A0A6C0ACN3_9ZZZZ